MHNIKCSFRILQLPCNVYLNIRIQIFMKLPHKCNYFNEIVKDNTGKWCYYFFMFIITWIQISWFLLYFSVFFFVKIYIWLLYGIFDNQWKNRLSAFWCLWLYPIIEFYENYCHVYNIYICILKYKLWTNLFFRHID